MRRLSLRGRLWVGALRRLSRVLVAAGRRLRAVNTRRGDAPGAVSLRFVERSLFASGRRAGARANARTKFAKRQAALARSAERRGELGGDPAARADGVSTTPVRPTDLHALVSERHAADTGRVRRELAQLAAGDDPVIVGPFVGEVGFELLYWVPFVKWVLHEYPRLRGRLIVTARGGTRAWYGDGVRDYVDMLDVFTPEEFTERRQDYKQRGTRALDVEFLSALSERFGLREPKVLEPALMYNAYYSAVKTDERSFVSAIRPAGPYANEPLFGLRSVYTPIAPPPLVELEELLPPEFVAARFYFSPAFPEIPENRALANEFLAALAERTPVVLLNNGLELDDHIDVDLDSPRIVTVADRMTPANNLHVQTTILTRARGFVGTYGGLSYLAPHLGIPSLAFFGGGPAPFSRHLELAQQIFRGPPWGSIAALTTRDRELLDVFVETRSTATTP